jgi:hypothetical protein
MTWDAEENDDLTDLAGTAESSTGFWDNPLDDEDWNDAGTEPSQLILRAAT